MSLYLAASDSDTEDIGNANYRCDGTNDNVEIAAAIAALPAAGGEVVLLPGTYNVALMSNILRSNLTLCGAGKGQTTIRLQNGANSRLMYQNTAVSNVRIEGITWDGNKNNQTDGAGRDDRAGLLLFKVSNFDFIRNEVMNVRSGASLRVYGCDNMLEFGNHFHDNGVQTTTTGSHTLPQATINVTSTTGFQSSGKVYVGNQLVTYTGTTATTLTGASGGTGTISAGTLVWPAASVSNQLLICDAVFHASAVNLRVLGNYYYNNTDTGTAMDGIHGAQVVGNQYRLNALGVGVGFSNLEESLYAWSSYDITIADNTIQGLNNAFVEHQGIKIGAFGNVGEGINNHSIHVHDNTIFNCDRAIWIDELDDSEIHHNTMRDAVGPNKQLLLIAPAATDVNRVKIYTNKYRNTTNRGISFDAGTITGIEIFGNDFQTVNEPVGGTIPGDTRIWSNPGYSGRQGMDGLLFANTTVPAAVANTTTETNFAQSYTVKANSLRVGNVLRVIARGVWSSTTGPPTLNLRVKLGTTVIGATGALATVASMTNRGWEVSFDMTVLTLGASGTVEGQGGAFLSTSATTGASLWWDIENTAAVTVNTTIDQALQLSGQWGTASASNTITMRQLIVELLSA